MDIEAKKQEIETFYKEACEKAVELNQALIKMRDVELPTFTNNDEMKAGHGIIIDVQTENPLECRFSNAVGLSFCPLL